MKTGIIWTTKEGKEIDLADMTDSHLSNAIKFLQKKIKAYPGHQDYVGDGELAEEAVERENELNEEHLDECQYMIIGMREEQKRRKDTDGK